MSENIKALIKELETVSKGTRELSDKVLCEFGWTHRRESIGGTILEAEIWRSSDGKPVINMGRPSPAENTDDMFELMPPFGPWSRQYWTLARECFYTHHEDLTGYKTVAKTSNGILREGFNFNFSDSISGREDDQGWGATAALAGCAGLLKSKLSHPQDWTRETAQERE